MGVEWRERVRKDMGWVDKIKNGEPRLAVFYPVVSGLN